MACTYKRIAALCLLAATLLSGCGTGGEPSVYAVVNGEDITREDYQRYENFLRLAQTEVELSRDDQKMILQDLVDLKIYLAEAVKRGFTVDEEDLQAEYESYRTQILKKDLFDGSQVVYYTRLQELGIGEDWIRGLLGEYQVVNAMADAQKEKAEAPSAEAIEEYYNKNKDTLYTHGELREVRHILLNKGNFSESEEDVPTKVKALADSLSSRLKAGEDFSQLAKEYSQDTGSGKIGGSIGFIEKGDLVESFGNMAFSLDLNVVSQPVESQFGWHILEVTAIKPAGHYELDSELKERISATLLADEQKKAVEKLLLGLKEEAEVSYRFK